MRPVRIIATVLLTAAVAATGSFIARSTAHPSAAPAPPVAAAGPTSPAPTQSTLRTQPPGHPTVADVPVDNVPRPVLADGRYDTYIRTVDTDHNRLVVDLVQVFSGQAAVDAAIADGTPRERAQYLDVWVRNQNPRLRTLPLTHDVRLDLRGSCEEPRSQQFARLAANARLLLSDSRHAYYYTLTVQDGAVQRVQEFVAFNAC
jgi:hypothetical protein